MKTLPHRLALSTAAASVIAAGFVAPSSADAATPAPRVIQLPTVVVVAKRAAAASTFVANRTLPVAVPKAAAPV